MDSQERIAELEAEVRVLMLRSITFQKVSSRLQSNLNLIGNAFVGSPVDFDGHWLRGLPDRIKAMRAVFDAAVHLWDATVVVPGDASVSSHELNDFGQIVDANRTKAVG